MKLAYKLFLTDQNDEYVFGPGKCEILRAIKELGSLRQAALSIGMSYRWAWGRIRDLEQDMGVPLLLDDVQKSRAKKLSPAGNELLEWYENAQKKLDIVREELETALPSFLRGK